MTSAVTRGPTPSFSTYEVHRLWSAPRPEPEADGAAAESARTLFAALVAAHGSLLAAGDPDAALVSAWIRPPDEEQFHFVVGGRPGLPGTRPSLRQPGRDAVLFPPGSLGARLDGVRLDNLVARFPCWLRCGGMPDMLSRQATDERAKPHGDFLRYASHLGHAFAWLVVAAPLAPDVLEARLMRLMTEIPRLRQRTSSEPDRIELERAEARFRELTKARVSGLWNVHVLVGAQDEVATRTSGALLSAAGRVDRVGYVLAPGGEVGPLGDVWERPITTGEIRSPVEGSAEMLAAIATPPSQELPGLRLVARNAFDVTPEHSDGGLFSLGTVLDRAYESAGRFAVGPRTLNRHAFVTGATGSGKSQTTRRLLEQLSRADPAVPWLVIEPAKAEYAGMAGRLEGVSTVLRITPGDPDLPPASINPLEPAPGFPLQSHLDLVRALFLAAFEAAEPFPQVLSHALSRLYQEAGWDLVTGGPRPATKPRYKASDAAEAAVPRYPRLDELQETARRVVAGIGYGAEVEANVRGFIDVRLGSLIAGTPGRFFQGGHPLDVEDLLLRNAVIEIERVTDDQDKAFLIGAILIRIVEHLRVRYGARGTDELKHVLVIEEAHRLLKYVESGPAAAAVELFASLLAEIRAYGEGIVVVEQIPSKVITDVIKNTALKIVHRLPAQDDRDAVGGTMNLSDEQSRAVVALDEGTAAITVDGMDAPVLVQVKLGAGREDPAAALTDPPRLGRRSAFCGEECQACACTLAEMNAARHVARQPEWVVWAEVVTIGVLSGLVPPRARTQLLDAVRHLSPRIRACALSYAAEERTGARRGVVRRWFDPNDLTAVVHAQLLAQVEGLGVEVPEPPRWQVGSSRYRDVKRELRQLAETGRPVEPALLTRWADRDLRLTGSDPVAMREELEARERRDDSLDTALMGDPEQSGLRAALLELGGSLEREDVLRAVETWCEDAATEHIGYVIAARLSPISVRQEGK